MSQPNRAADCSQVYFALVTDGIVDSFGHLVAAAHASAAAEIEFVCAGEADTARGRRMYLAAANKARAKRDFHELLADGEAAFESVEPDIAA